MEDEQQKIADNFSKNLKATDYMDQMIGYWEDSPELFRFNIKFIHDVFRSGALGDCYYTEESYKRFRFYKVLRRKAVRSVFELCCTTSNIMKFLIVLLQDVWIRIWCASHLSFIYRETLGMIAENKFQGTKLLEIGSGVTVHSIASASQYFPSIVMSDYVADNVEELRKWLTDQSSIKQMLDVQAELEGYGNDLATGKKLIESRIRKNVKRVTRCDVLKDDILLEKDTNLATSPPYDVVVSCLCLEVCPVDVKGYGDIMKRINSLLQPGGGLLLVGFFQGSTWEAGGHTFHYIKIDKPDLLDALTNAGFGDIEIKTMSKEGAQYKNFTCSEIFCLAAKKMNNVK